MKSEWKNLSLSDVGVIKTGKTPAKKIEGAFGAGMPFITPKDMNDRKTIRKTERYISKVGIESLKNYVIPEKCVLVSCIGSDMGKVMMTDRDSITNQQINSILIDKEKYSPDYIYYNLSIRRNELHKMAGGTTMPIINKTDFSKIAIKIPPLPIQKKIAHILSTIDDKIELNRKMNETLEAMAQALFKSWFVDFDPVHARAKATSDAELEAVATELGISREVLELFPDRFVESEMGMVPEGWEHDTLGSFVEILDSKRIPLAKNERAKRQGIIPYYGATSIMDYIDDFIFDEPLTLLGEDGSVVRDDGTPFMQYIWGKAWINNHAHVIKSKSTLSTEAIYVALHKQNVTMFVTGAVQPKINQTNLKRIPIIKPSGNLHEVYSDLIAPMFSKIRQLSDEIETLVKTRDTLLPKLLSGELDVSEVEI